MNQYFTSIFKSFLVVSLLSFSYNAYSQGCVGVRGITSCSGTAGANQLDSGNFQISIGYRWLHSFRHFRGKHEERDRLVQQTEVINKTHSVDLTGIYAFTPSLSVAITLPFAYYWRSSLYEHGRVERHSSEASGIGDIRVTINKWLFNPKKNHNSNLSIGFGIKAPTGNYNAKDRFYNVSPEGSSETRPVDQSIQPGDGGWGAVTELQGFKKLFHRGFLYGNAFYLFNPKNTNGTRTFRETLSPLLINESIMSVPDQYLLRMGLQYDLFPKTGLSVNCGGRYEGIPIKDAIGRSNGFRRPGYIISVEPGISYLNKNNLFTLNVPVAIVRNRTQSLTDKENEKLTGTSRHGDAAFADYFITFTYAHRFN